MSSRLLFQCKKLHHDNNTGGAVHDAAQGEAGRGAARQRAVRGLLQGPGGRHHAPHRHPVPHQTGQGWQVRLPGPGQRGRMER